MTFSTEIFHPLITPLTTYMYTTDIQDGGTVSATDEERLPPGGFSLRHGFPAWFGRASRSRQTSGQHSAAAARTPPRTRAATASSRSGSRPGGRDATPASAHASSPGADSVATTPGGTRSYAQTGQREVSTHEVLEYIARTFDDEDVLDSIPLEAAGNPGAWHAWRTRQRQRGKAPTVDVRGEVKKFEAAASSGAEMARRPGEWNWDGVWEERVKKGIAASLSEPVLYGNAAGGGDDVVSVPCVLTNSPNGLRGGSCAARTPIFPSSLSVD